MKFAASQPSLVAAFSNIIKAIPSKHPTPVCLHVHAALKGNNLTLTAYNLEYALEQQIEVKGLRDGAFLIPARETLNMLKALPDIMVDCESKGERFAITYSTGIYTDNKGQVEFATEYVGNYPKFPSASGKTFLLEIPREKLVKNLTKLLPFVSRDELRPQLTGLYFELTQGLLRLVTTDGHRMTRISRLLETDQNIEAKGIIPSAPLSNLLQLLKAPGNKKTLTVSILAAMGESGVESFSFVFSTPNDGRLTLSVAAIEGRYPNFDAVIPDHSKTNHVLTVDKDGFESSVARMALVSNEISRQVRLRCNGKVILCAEDIETGKSASEDISEFTNWTAHDEDEFAIGFNAGYMLDVLKPIETGEAVLKMGRPQDGIIITPTEDDENEELLLLCMPVRLN
jgi:DNA polymerase-3 subunit beta